MISIPKGWIIIGLLDLIAGKVKAFISSVEVNHAEISTLFSIVVPGVLVPKKIGLVVKGKLKVILSLA